MAVEEKDENLQALIMFLVFEKEVLSMDSDTSELNLYFLEKHRKRMNRELNDYKEKMNMKSSPIVYCLKGEKTVYVLASNEYQAITTSREYNAHVSIIDTNRRMIVNSQEVKLEDIIKNKQAPFILGEY